MEPSDRSNPRTPSRVRGALLVTGVLAGLGTWGVGCASSGDEAAVGVGTTREALLVSNDLVISQVFGGGGNANAPYTHDFVELMNRGSAPVSLGGKAIQYASSSANFAAATAVALPTVTLAPGQYFLVQLSTNGNVGSPLPTADLVTAGAQALALSAAQGKVALVVAAAPLDACGSVASPCAASAFIDLVGYGLASQAETSATPTLSNTTAAIRLGGGCVDTGDNGADFAIGSPLPRTTASALSPCTPDVDAGTDASPDADDGATDAVANDSASIDASDAAPDADAAPVDAGSDAADAAVDAGSDAASSVDAATDAGSDAASPPDAAADASVDAGKDAGKDASADASAVDAGPPASLVLLNEFRSNPPTSNDAPFEYVEILCTPSASLTGFYFVAFEGDGDSNGPPGTADFVVDFDGVTCGSNGIVYVKAGQGGQSAGDASSTVVTSSFLDTGASPIENATTSFVVVHSPSAPIVQTTDYDTNDDGTLELPSGAIIVDGVSTFDESPTAHDRTYAPRLTQPKGTADGATRFPGDTTPLSIDAWYAADLLGSQGDSVTYDSTNASPNFPGDGAMTPGAVNVGTEPTTVTDAGTDAIAPTDASVADATEALDATIDTPDAPSVQATSDAALPKDASATDAAKSELPNPPSVRGCFCDVTGSRSAGGDAAGAGALALVALAWARRRPRR